MQKVNIKKPADKAAAPKADQYFLFGKQNYMLMLAGVLLIALGFYLMAGTEDIFSSTKLTVAPIIVMIGFVVELFAIMRKKANS
jgi:hypothetical protein